MKALLCKIIILVVAFYILLLKSLMAGPLDETRYCGPPKRDVNGRIVRRADVLAAFQKAHPCPATGLKTGACKGWQKNHAIPLACGGCDEVSNLYWANERIKTCADDWCIDRFERKVYASLMPIEGTPACTNVIVTLP